VSPNNLSDARKLVRSGRKWVVERPDEAILRLQDALKLVRLAKGPEGTDLEIEALTALAGAYVGRQGASHADDIEAAIRCYKQALHHIYKRPRSERKKEGSLIDRIRASLAVAYDARILGSNEENINQILVYTDSLDLDSKKDTELRARAKLIRGKAFRDRSQGFFFDQDVALNFMSDALKLLNKREAPEYWAEAHFQIGKTLLGANGSMSEVSWKDAEKHFQSALKVYDRQVHPLKFAMVEEQLGHYYLRCEREMDGQFREEALGHYSISVQHLSPENNPREWANVHVAIARLALDGGIYALKTAVSHFEAALGALKPSENGAARLSVLQELAHVYLSGRKWQEALPRFEEALEVAKTVLREAHTLEGRRTAAKDISGLANGFAYCLYQLERLDEAVVTLESGKAWLLSEKLEWTDNEDSRLSALERKRLTILYREIQKLESTQYGGIGAIETSDRLEVLRKRLASTTARLQGKRQSSPQELPQLSEWSSAEPGTAVVMPLITLAGSVLFVLSQGNRSVERENVIPLPNLTTEEINAWLIGGRELNGWLPSYQQRIEGAEQQDAWRATMLKVCGSLWETIISKLRDRLRELNVTSIVMLPGAGLQFLPIHAASWVDEKQTRYFIDEVAVSYAPSATIWSVSKRRVHAHEINGVSLIAGVGQYESLPPLSSVKDELEMVGAALDSSVLLDGEATAKRVLQRMPGSSIIHIACHGAAWALGGTAFKLEWEAPAVLNFSQGGLTFQNILSQDLRHVRLVCLSACETGLVDASLAWDEFEGLANVFLQAGASSIVSSLWSVDDRSTALLMYRFYENLKLRGHAPPVALRESQLWLRDCTRKSLGALYETMLQAGRSQFMDAYTELMLGGDGEEQPYAHPFYWASFTYTGA
jgi:CHAT domain-containing protein/tetratricopeptide (TPR) repeat protein